MKSIRRVMNFFAITYRLLSGLMLVNLFFIFVMRLAAWFEPRVKIYLVFEWADSAPDAIQLAITFALHGLIFRGLAQFVEAKRSNAAVESQRQALTPLPKYLVGLYVLSIIAIFTMSGISDSEVTRNAVKEWMIAELIVPEFSGSLSLVLALVIHLFVKSLGAQEALAAETKELKQEAELVI